MREVVFKNMTFKNAKKREICLEEVVTENGHISKIFKKSLYFVTGIKTINSQEEFNSWVQNREENTECSKRRFHIMKIHSDKEQTDTVLCKALGSFYVISGKEVYNLVFMHSLRMEISAVQREKV